MLLRVFIFLLILLIPIIPMGQSGPDLSVGEDGVLKNLPVCEAGSFEIGYVGDRQLIWEQAATIGIASVDFYTGNFAIFYDPIALADAPPEFQYWALRHECGHFTQGHVADSRFRITYAAADLNKKEREADVDAIKDLINVGFTDSQIDIVYEYIVDPNYIVRHMPPYQRPFFEGKAAKAMLLYSLEERGNHFKKHVDQERAKISRKES